MITEHDYDMLEDERATMEWERHLDGVMTEAEYRTAFSREGVDPAGLTTWADLYAAYDEVFGVTDADV